MNTISQIKSDVNKKFERNCPKCNIIMLYKHKSHRNVANKKKLVCRSCAMNRRYLNPEERKKASIRSMGENGSFYGRHHTPEMKAHFSKIRLGISQPASVGENLKKYYKTHDNPMKGRSVYSIWLNKYGKEIADDKMIAYKLKQSKLNSGKNNSMYGKPSPHGAGQGWKGYYKTHFFRSLRELSYMIYLEENNIIWESGEVKKFSVDYVDYKGIKITNRPDFFINNNELIEI